MSQNGCPNLRIILVDYKTDSKYIAFVNNIVKSVYKNWELCTFLAILRYVFI